MIRIKNLKIKLLCTVTFGMFVGVLYLLKVPCIFLNISNLQCPGCGMTRAWISALSLDFAQAFKFHPLWFTVPAFFVFGIVSYKRKCYKGLQIELAIFVGLFLTTYLLRLLFGSTIVVFDPSEGLIF